MGRQCPEEFRVAFLTDTMEAWAKAHRRVGRCGGGGGVRREAAFLVSRESGD